MLGLATNFALLHMLTPPEYVVYGLAFTIITVGVVIGSMGLPKTVVQFVAENVALNQTGQTRRAISLVLGLGVFGALGVSLAHRDLTTHPGTPCFEGLPRSVVFRVVLLEVWEHVLGALSGPEHQ